MTPPSSRQPPRIGTVELDIASTLINEANALLRQHGEDPGNDGTGDDLPVLTEVIFDLGESPDPAAPQATPAAPTRAKHAAPASAPPAVAAQPVKPTSPPLRQPAPQPQSAAPAPTAQPFRAQADATPPRTQTSAPALSVPPPGLQTGARPPARPTTPPTAARSPSGAQPPRTQSTPAQRPTTPPTQPLTSTTAASRPSFQTGAATRLPPSHSLSQAELQSAWPRSTFSSTPAVEPTPKPQAPVRQPATPVPPMAEQSPPPSPDTTAAHMQAIVEELKLLDTLIIGEVEAWLREELPALVVREISRLNERLRTEAITHLRATLLPRISEQISKQIEHALDATPAVHEKAHETTPRR